MGDRVKISPARSFVNVPSQLQFKIFYFLLDPDGENKGNIY
jgi:hypothetical protein